MLKTTIQILGDATIFRCEGKMVFQTQIRCELLSRRTRALG
jgi:hypothetical protein